MELQWFGRNCFVLKKSDVTILIDPFKEVLRKLPQKVDVVVRTNADDEKFDAEGIEVGRTFDWPGEYEAKGIAITLTPTDKFTNDCLLAHFVVEDCNVVNLGYLNQDLTDELTEALGDIDVLIVPVGGKDVLKAKKALDVVEVIEPKMVVPSCFAGGDNDGGYDGVEAFMKEVGVSAPAPVDKLKLKDAGMLPVDRTDYVILEAA